MICIGSMICFRHYRSGNKNKKSLESKSTDTVFIHNTDAIYESNSHDNSHFRRQN
jgi:hypothetical protein